VTEVSITKSAAPRSQNTRPRLIGILNLLPESNIPGSVVTERDDIGASVQALLSQGADIIEFGAHSTNVCAPRIDDADEQRRLLPVLRDMKRSGCLVSVDTWSPATAHAALNAGADMTNFTSSEPTDDLYRTVTTAGASLLLTYLPYANAYACAKPQNAITAPKISWPTSMPNDSRHTESVALR